MIRNALSLFAAFPLLASCGPGYTRNPVPPALAYEAVIPGLEHDRIIGVRGALDGFAARRAELIEDLEGSDLTDEPLTFLSISGGGQKGAFGAGLLCGWTERGDRPEFAYVTGISTGALIAPFAYLGPAYDEKLKEVYTTLETRDLVSKRGPLAILTKDAVASTDGLREKIELFVTDAMIDEIAREHQRGRRLVVGTTNLDLMEPVYWHVSAIAASDRPDRAEIIRKILLASASIPVAFPPVYFEVEAGGETYDEMHVDGGAANQVFAYPSLVDLDEELERIGVSTRGWRLFVIRNAHVIPQHEAVEPRVGSIAGRSISSMIRTQGIGDMYQIFLLARRDGLEFNLAYIAEDFDPVYMGRLFELGRSMAAGGYPWFKGPEQFLGN